MKENYTFSVLLNKLSNIKGIYVLLLAISMLFTINKVQAQCTNSSSYGSATAPTSGTVTISTCNYLEEYSPISSVVSGTTYSCAIITGGYVTIRSGSYNGAVVAHGTSPLQWTATSSGTYYAHWNTNSSCGTTTGCVTTTITFVSTGAPPCSCPAIVSTFPYSEGFETGMGYWENRPGDDFDWTRQTGGTSSGGTGPSAAAEGSYYMYTESSTPNYSNKTATMYGPCLDFSSMGGIDMSFQYHMYGAVMGTLYLEASGDNCGTWNTVWSLSGDQGNSWHTANVDLSTYAGNSSVQLRFRGLTSTSYTSDMSIDDIEIIEAVAPPCSPIVSSYPCNYMWITNVTTSGGLTNFNSTSGCSSTSYTDYSGTYSVSQVQGGVVNLSLTTQSYGMDHVVWIDFNDDLTFSAGEKVLTYVNPSSTTAVNTSFTIPVGATLGSHKMRIRSDYYGTTTPTDPCAALTYGETEDYTCIVAVAVILPITPNTPTSNSPGCGSVTITANGTPPSGETWYWQTSASGTSTTSSGSTYNVTTSGTYYIRSYRTSDGAWSAAASVAVTVNPLPIISAISATPATICSGGSSNLNATSTGNIIHWWNAATGGTEIGTSASGANYAVTPSANTTYFAEAVESVSSNELIISEICTASSDWIEIQNTSGGTWNKSGWILAVSNSGSSINSYNSNFWSLGSFTTDQVKFKDDVSSSSQYWGSNLMWSSSYGGWAMIIDDAGNVIDEVFWGFSASEIALFNATINGHVITASSFDWDTDGISSYSNDYIARSTYNQHQSIDWVNVTIHSQNLENPGIQNVSGSGTGCTSATRTPVTVTVYSSFSTGAINTTGQTICSGDNPSIIGSTTAASGGDGTITYSWRSSANSYASAILGAISSTYTPPAGLTTTTSYRRYAKDNTCSTTPTVSTGTWTVTVNPLPTGVSAGSDVTICNGSSSQLSGSANLSTVSCSLTTTFAAGNGAGGGNMFDLTTGVNSIEIDAFTILPYSTATQTVNVYYKSGSYVGSETTSGSWILLGTYSINGVTSTQYYLDIANLIIPANQTYGIYVNFNAKYTTLTANTTYSDSYLTLTAGVGLGGLFTSVFSPRAFNGIVHYNVQAQLTCSWSPTTGLSNPNILNPVATPSSTTTYTMTATASGCGVSDNVTVNVDPLPTASAGGSQDICVNETATVSGASASNGTIAWTEDGAGSITSGATTLTPTYTPAAGDAGNTVTLTMTVNSNNNCSGETATGTWTVTVRPDFTAGTILSTGETICQGTDPANISSTAVASGGDNTITYKWQANGVDISGATSASYNPPGGLTVTTTYRRWAHDGTCNTGFEVAGGSWVVTVTTAPTPGGIGTGDYFWTGANGNSWDDVTNWLYYNGTLYSVATLLPSATSNVFIQSYDAGTCATTNAVTTASSTVYCEDMNIGTGLTLGGLSSLEVTGDWNNSGTFNAGNGTVAFNGSGLQTINAGVGNFNNILFDNSFGNHADIEITSPMTIEGTATFTHGIVYYSGGGSLTFINSATANVSSNNSFVDGMITKTGINEFIFPTGDVSSQDFDGNGSVEYAIAGALGIHPTGASTVTVTAQYNFSNTYMPDWWEHGGNMDLNLHHVSNRENWIVNSDQDMAVTLYWFDNTHVDDAICVHGFDDGISGDFVASDLLVAYWNGSMWANIDFNSDPLLTSFTHDAGFIRSRFPVTFGAKSNKIITFGSKSNENPLPVNLVKFEADCNNGNIDIQWTTASEINNDYFTIERSSNAKDFDQIGKIDGNGNSNNLLNYIFKDPNFSDGINYYRLTQVDYDGTSKTYNFIQASCNQTTANQSVVIYPNPFRDIIYIYLENFDKTDKINVELFNHYGQIIMEYEYQNAEISSIDLSKLPPAMYMIVLTSGDNIFTKKIIKN